MKTKRGLSLPADYMGWVIMGVFILITIIVISLILKGKLTEGIDYFKSLLRFGKG